MLLQVLDDGFLTDSLGRKINFQNTIIIMTSNIGARQVKDFGTGVGFETSNMKSQANDIEKSVIQNALKKTFAPEFLNRIDDVVIFNTLEKEDIEQIVDIELIKLTKRVEKLGYGIALTKAAKAFISDKGFDKKYGARPLNRAIQKYIENLLAENVVNNNIEEGTDITLDHKKGDEELHINRCRGERKVNINPHKAILIGWLFLLSPKLKFFQNFKADGFVIFLLTSWSK